jgi:aryl-alcohol dehydrogenase-like predicted oxidoreductase
VIGGLGDQRPFVATKMGRRLPQVHESYTPAHFREWLERSRENLGMETLDLVQLHCPPSSVIDDDALFDDLDSLVADRVIAAYGVSVETCDQALAAIARPSVVTVQIILNAFRLKPLDEVLPAASAAGVGIIARVPLASGLLSGRYDASTTFGADDHRSYNRTGAAFDVGETFSGLDFETGLEAVRRLVPHVPPGLTLPQWALRFVLDQPGMSVVIPGARNVEQARANAAAARIPPLDPDSIAAIHEVYDELIRPEVHARW